eukprot:TRINITY_DN2176_c0_g5_i2.p1 TRINITY_DN2176_c0_g5~~TRINITY_DN2176_c0_g5_i2.p1  ORF type:complete len:1338 (+),score=328.87 TRINITY_DN2176_c0_g5_i2:43-4056(+)
MCIRDRWYPLQSLQACIDDDNTATNNDSASTSLLTTTTSSASNETAPLRQKRTTTNQQTRRSLISSVIAVEEKLCNIYARNAIVSLLSNWPTSIPLSLPALAGTQGLVKTLNLIAKVHLCQTIPTTKEQDSADPFLHILSTQLQSLCNKNQPLAATLLDEAERLLLESTRFAVAGRVVVESSHPCVSDFEASVQLHHGATGAVLTFARKSKLADADILTIYTDKRCTNVLKSYSGSSLRQFHPVAIPAVSATRAYIKLLHSRATADGAAKPEWGFLMTIMPTCTELNLALWIIEFLVEDPNGGEWIPNLYSKVYTLLVTFLIKARMPEPIKVVILRLMKRALQLFVIDAGRLMEDGVADELVMASLPLHDEMTDLLNEIELLHSTYLQTLVEVMALVHRIKAIANPSAVPVYLVHPTAAQKKKNKKQTKKSARKKTTKKRKRGQKDGDDEKEAQEEKPAVVPMETEENSSSSKSAGVIAPQADDAAFKTFSAVINVDHILSCFLDDNGQFPDAFVRELDWTPSELIAHDPVPAMTPSGILRLTNKGQLTPRARLAFIEVFNRFGIQRRGSMSRKELNVLQVHCQPDEPLSTEELDFFFDKYQTNANGDLTLKGFLDLYYREAYRHPKNVWDELSSLGYDKRLVLSRRVCCAHYLQEPARWRVRADGGTSSLDDHNDADGGLSLDGQIIALMNNLVEVTGKNLRDVAYHLVHADAAPEWPMLAEIPLAALRMRFAALKRFNLLLQDALPLVDLTQHSTPASFAQRLCFGRHLIAQITKTQFVNSVLTRVVSNQRQPAISISRLHSVLRSSRELSATGGGGVYPFSASQRYGGGSYRLPYDYAARGGLPHTLLPLSTTSTARQSTSLYKKNTSVFVQAFEQLNSIDPSLLRQPQRAFVVTLRGETVEGDVGPYQETISQICSELQPDDEDDDENNNNGDDDKDGDNDASDDEGDNVNFHGEKVGLFIPCPNRQQARQQIGIGENRDKFIPKPSANSERDLNMFEFVGKLLGIAMSTKSMLSLNFPPIFWKKLVGHPYSVRDLKAIDYSTVHSLYEICTGMSKEEFSNKIFTTWTCKLSDGSTVALERPDDGSGSTSAAAAVDSVRDSDDDSDDSDFGDDAADLVTFEERNKYRELVIAKRLEESEAQMQRIVAGLGKIIPLCLLSLFTWQDIELRVCGKTEIDLDVLRRNTRYRDVKETDPHIKYFWDALKKFTQRQRMMFLRFAWGRSRLPGESELKREPMKIFPYPCDNPDSRLPHAETCFFNIKVPAYSSAQVMYDRILYAITHTKSIDADVQAEPAGRGRGQFGGFPYRGGFGGRGHAQLFGFGSGRGGRGRGRS